jgi:hypothetical protein
MLLTGAPRFAGSPQGSSVLCRLLTQISQSPNPPGRFEAKYNSNPSAEVLQPASPQAVLTVAPRFRGLPTAKSALAIGAQLQTTIRMPHTTVAILE